MADEQIVTNIVARSDFSGLIADVQRTTAALAKLQQELSVTNKTLAAQAGQIQKSFSETLRSTGQFSSHFVTVGSQVDSFGKSLDNGKLKLKDYFRTWQEHTRTSGGLIRDLAKQQVALQNAVVQPLGKTADGLMKFNVQVPKGLDAIANKTALAKKELQIYNKVIQDGGVQLINWGKNTQWAGRQLTVGLTVPIAAFGMAASKAFREADQELVRLTKVYGGVAATSSIELAKVRKDVTATARELASAYGSSFKETIALAADIAATGKQGNELLASTKETTRLAVLGEVDRQDAMKATLALQNAFKQNTTELAESINFLNAVENQTSTSLGDLIEAIPKAGPVIQGMGGSVKDLALYLTAMKEGGINASEGANALKSALASIINPTKVAREMFAGFGIDLGGIVTKNAGDLTGTLTALQDSLDKLNPLQKQQAIEQLFGKFQFARMNALFANLGKQGSQTLQVMDLMKASSADLANVAGRELSQITESASGKYQRALQTLKADLAGVGESFLNVQTFFLNLTSSVVKFIEMLPGPIKSLLTLVAGVTALAGPLIMLTGVFANFIGYVIKGIGHLKALFKGGEGFKLLTPEILAASKAGSLVEQTFYSDAAAADILSASLKNLITEFTILQQKAAAGAISVNPTIATLAGTVAMAGTPGGVYKGVTVDPNNPLVGRMGTRASAHMNPVGNMSEAERAAQTIFGMVPGPIPVNRKIGKNPQMYASHGLPAIPGLTTIGGVSTGVIPEEAAKWHAMTGAIAMQSEAEITLLKKEVAATGTVTHELSSSYQALLPEITRLTTLAAQEGAEIVAQTQAGALTVEQSRAKIVALNARVEAMIAETTTNIAIAQGRTANLTTVPFTNQPVVDPKTGKSNMKEMFHKTPTATLVDNVARALGGIRTSGGGYSTGTTTQNRNQGGPIYYNNGDRVPGSGNTDTVPAMLTPGEFVIRKKIAESDPVGMRALNNGQAKIVQSRNLGGPILAFLKTLKNSARPMLASSLIQRVFPGRLTSRAGADFYEPKGNTGIFGGNVQTSKISATTAKINKEMEGAGVDPRTLLASINARGGGSRSSTDVFLQGLLDSGVISRSEFRTVSKKTFSEYARSILKMDRVNDKNNPIWSVSDDILKKELASNSAALEAWNLFSSSPGSFAHPTRRSSTGFLNKIVVNGKTINFKNLEASGKNKFYHAKEESNPFIKLLQSLISNNGDVPGRAMGGPVSGANPYVVGENGPELFVPQNSGKIIPGFNKGGQVQHLAAGGEVMAMLMRMIPGLAGYGLGSKLTGGSMMGGMLGGIGGDILGGMLANKILNIGKAAGEVTKKVSLTQKALSFLKAKPIFGWAGAFLAGAAVIKSVNDKINEHRRVINLAFGQTSESASKLGINYKSLNEQLKEFKDRMDLANASANAFYASSTFTNGLNLTIKQFQDLKNSVQKDLPDLIEVFNKAGSNEVIQKASQLKAQFISGGMSAEKATNTIYALIASSNKSSLALQVLADEGFGSIIDKTSAAITSIETFNSLLNAGNTDQLAPAFQTLITSVQEMEKSLVGTKDETGKIITASQAWAITMQKVSSAQGSSASLTSYQYAELQKTTPELYKILNGTESTAAVLSKWKIYISGARVELKGMTDEMAIAFAAAQTNLSGVLSSGTTGTDLDKIVSAINNANKASLTNKTVIQKNAKDAQEALKAEIALHQENIDKIKEEADARRKSLSRQTEDEDILTQIKKKQLEYQDALATGDSATAAQAQLDLQMLQRGQQKTLALREIDDKEKADIAAQQAIIDALQRRLDATSKTLETQLESADKAVSKVTKLKSLLADIVSFISSAGTTTSEEELRKANELQNRANELGLKDVKIGTLASSASEQSKKDFVSKLFGTGAGKLAYPDKTGIDSILSTVIKNGMLQTADVNALASNNILNKILTVLSKTNQIAPSDLGQTGSGQYASNFVTASVLSKYGISPNVKTGSYLNEVIQVGSQSYQISGFDKSSGRYSLRKLAIGGPIKHYEPGGNVRGPGTGTSDSIPAMLSNGEYVIKADSVKKYGVDTFDALNAQKFHAGGKAGHKHDVSKGNWFSKFNPTNAISSMLTGMFNFGTSKATNKNINIQSKVTQQEKDRMLLQTAQMLSGYTSAFNLKNNTSPEILGSKSLGVALDTLGVLPGLGLASKLLKPANLYKPVNTVNQYSNYFKAKKLVKQGQYHGSAEVSNFDPPLSGQSILDGTYGNDPHYGMGFFSTSSKSEADLYAGGYNVPGQWGEAYGSMNQVTKIPFGKYIDFSKNNIKSQNYMLWKLLQGKDYRYAGENLGSLMNQVGTTGSIMPRISAGQAPGDINSAIWLALNKPKGTALQEMGTTLNSINKKSDGSRLTSLDSAAKLIREVLDSGAMGASDYSAVKGVRLLTNNKMGPNTGGAYTIGENKIELPSIFGGGTAIHEAAHHIDATSTRTSLQNFLDLLSGTNPTAQKFGQIGDIGLAHRILKTIKNTEAYGTSKDEAYNTVSSLLKTDVANGGSISRYAIWEGILEGHAHGMHGSAYRKLLELGKIDVAKKIGDPYHKGTLYFPTLLDQITASMQPGKSYIRNPSHLVGQLIADPNMPEMALQKLLRRIEILNNYGITGKEKNDAKKLISLLNTSASVGWASGGYINPAYSPRMSVPQFKNGINMVPADMLAMIHKNEAIVPANMNPFNPNANNATMAPAVYNISMTNHAAEGMDVNTFADVTTRKVLAEIKRLDVQRASMNGIGRRV